MKKLVLTIFIVILLLAGCGNSEKYKGEFNGWSAYPAKDIIELAEKSSCGGSLENGVSISYKDKKTSEWFTKEVRMTVITEELSEKTAYGVYERSYMKKAQEQNVTYEDQKILEETKENIYFKYYGGKYYNSNGEVIQDLDNFLFYFQYSDMSVNYYQLPKYSKRSNTGDYYVEGMMDAKYTKGYLEATQNFHQYDLTEYDNSMVYMESSGYGGITMRVSSKETNKSPFFRHSVGCLDYGHKAITEYKEAYEAEVSKNGE